MSEKTQVLERTNAATPHKPPKDLPADEFLGSAKSNGSSGLTSAGSGRPMDAAAAPSSPLPWRKQSWEVAAPDAAQAADQNPPPPPLARAPATQAAGTRAGTIAAAATVPTNAPHALEAAGRWLEAMKRHMGDMEGHQAALRASLDKAAKAAHQQAELCRVLAELHDLQARAVHAAEGMEQPGMAAAFSVPIDRLHELVQQSADDAQRAREEGADIAQKLLSKAQV